MTGFYNRSNLSQCELYATKYFEQIEFVKETYHRDYAQVFIKSLSPTFLGSQDHLDKFREILERVEKADDSHFQNMLKDQIEELEEIIRIQSHW